MSGQPAGRPQPKQRNCKMQIANCKMDHRYDSQFAIYNLQFIIFNGVFFHGRIPLSATVQFVLEFQLKDGYTYSMKGGTI